MLYTFVNANASSPAEGIYNLLLSYESDYGILTDYYIYDEETKTKVFCFD